MKRFFALMMAAMMLCSVFVMESSATQTTEGVLSNRITVSPGDGPSRPEPPDRPDPDRPEPPDKPEPEKPEGEGPEKPEPEKPEAEKPVSPQTGYPIGIVGLSATAAACGAAAVIAGKKASKR